VSKSKRPLCPKGAGEGNISDVIYKKKEVLGLDIGTGRIKYVQLKKSKNLTKLIGYGSFEMPENIIMEGIISEPEKLAELIRKNLADPPWGKITAQTVVASLPESKLFNRTIEIPSIDDDDIDEAINYEIEQSIPIPVTDLYTDWQIVGESKEKYSVFLSAAPRSIIDSYVQLMAELKLEPLALEVSLGAITRAIIPEKEKDLATLIIDVGARTTNMAVYQSNLQIAASVPLGAEILKDALISALNIDAKEANELLLQGLGKQEKPSEIMKIELRKILEEMDHLVKYYQEKHNNHKVDQILLCGGIGSMNGLDEYIEAETKIKTKTGNPWSNISIYPIKPVSKQEASLYSAAIGLCLRGIEDE
jgi:type IV pilus assembly protein PilM